LGIGDWGLGIGVLGVGVWGLGGGRPHPTPKTPPTPHKKIKKIN